MDKKEVYESIKYRIITQELKPEQVLSEKELISHYGIGRTPLRDILIDLQWDGLINVLPRYGTFVTPLTLENLRNILEVRICLEELTADVLCDRITLNQLRILENLLQCSEETLKQYSDPACLISEKEVEKLLFLESDFHNSMYAATHNSYLIEALRKLQINSMRFWNYLGYDKRRVIREFDELREIFEALKNKNKKLCRKLLRAHVSSFVDLDSILKFKIGS